MPDSSEQEAEALYNFLLQVKVWWQSASSAIMGRDAVHTSLHSTVAPYLPIYVRHVLLGQALEVGMRYISRQGMPPNMQMHGSGGLSTHT